MESFDNRISPVEVRGMAAEKVLAIDDDPGLLVVLRMGLEKEGFEVITAGSGLEGLRRAYETHPDVIILDVMMPDVSGWETCQKLRRVCDTPIIMLTAKSEPADVLKGLSLGADDYINKPCSFDELKARIRTVIRRGRTNARENWESVYDDGYLRIDLAHGMVTKAGTPVDLTPTESSLLMCLVSKRGCIVSHKELLTSVWGPEYADETRYLSVYIRYLRQKIEDDPSNPSYIRTRWRVGYYFADAGVPG
jgi:two-component system KDP operon response regulator KdpE